MTDRPEIRRNPDGTIDEICADGVFFHLEQMDNGAWLIGLTYQDGRSARIWLSARNRKAAVSCSVEVDE
jgi:hypothetical protein